MTVINLDIKAVKLLAEKVWNSLVKFFGAYTQKILAHSAFRKKIKCFGPCFVARSWVSATKCGPLAKILAVEKKYISRNFRI